jgi:hypothetical protein
VREAAFCVALVRSAHHRDDRVSEARGSLPVQAYWVSEAEELATLITRMLSALVDLGLEPVRYILMVPNQAWEVLEAVDIVLVWLHEMLGIVTEAQT